MTPPTAPASVVAERLPGIYVHVPFCLRRCDYCDFTTFADRDEAIPAYVEALTAHIRRTPQDATFGSVFVGGGTPTYLPPDDLRQVLQALGDTFDFADDAEWTVEANPETVDAETPRRAAMSPLVRPRTSHSPTE